VAGRLEVVDPHAPLGAHLLATERDPLTSRGGRRPLLVEGVGVGVEVVEEVRGAVGAEVVAGGPMWVSQETIT
jgi:hypothetical protein